MTDPEGSDDLSGEGDAPRLIQDIANRRISDAQWRTRYRTVATGGTVILVGLLFWQLCKLVTAASAAISTLQAPAVGLVTALIVAIAVLSIALLRSTFAPITEPKPVKPEGDGSVVTTTAIEALKAVKDMAEVVLKGIAAKG